MRSTVCAVVIFYIFTTSYVGRCVSQTTLQTTPHSEGTTAPTVLDASSEPGSAEGGTHQNESVVEWKPDAQDIPDQPWAGAEDASNIGLHQFRFRSYVELNVRQITRNERCCGLELREFSDSNMLWSLTLGFPSRCFRCRDYHVERARCQIPKMKYDADLGVRVYRNWNCTTADVPREMFLAHSTLRPVLKIACEASKSDGDHNLCVLWRTCVTIAAMVEEDMSEAFLTYYVSTTEHGTSEHEGATNDTAEDGLIELKPGGFLQRDAVAIGIFIFAALMVSSAIAVMIYLKRGLHSKPYTRGDSSPDPK